MNCRDICTHGKVADSSVWLDATCNCVCCASADFHGKKKASRDRPCSIGGCKGHCSDCHAVELVPRSRCSQSRKTTKTDRNAWAGTLLSCKLLLQWCSGPRSAGGFSHSRRHTKNRRQNLITEANCYEAEEARVNGFAEAGIDPAWYSRDCKCHLVSRWHRVDH